MPGNIVLEDGGGAWIQVPAYFSQLQQAAMILQHGLGLGEEYSNLGTSSHFAFHL